MAWTAQTRAEALPYGRSRTWTDWMRRRGSVDACDEESDEGEDTSQNITLLDPIGTFSIMKHGTAFSYRRTLTTQPVVITMVGHDMVGHDVVPAVRLQWSANEGTACLGAMYVTKEIDFGYPRDGVFTVDGCKDSRCTKPRSIVFRPAEGVSPTEILDAVNNALHAAYENRGMGFAGNEATPMQPPPVAQRPAEAAFTLQITRHGTSCNNEFVGKLFGKDVEPHLSEYGIVETAALGRKQPERFHASLIRVSCLLRTWETATLLYGQHNEMITLRISPFLKEPYATILGNDVKRGNTPQSPNLQLAKFYTFLQHSSNTFSNLRIVHVEFPTDGGHVTASFSLDEQSVSYCVSTRLPDTYYDLPMFADLLKSDIGAFVRTLRGPEEVHTVAHSKVMKGFAKALNVRDVQYTHQNCWSMRMVVGSDYEVVRETVSFAEGYDKPRTGSRKNEMCATSDGDLDTSDVETCPT